MWKAVTFIYDIIALHYLRLVSLTTYQYSPTCPTAIFVKCQMLCNGKSEIRAGFPELYHRDPRFQIETGDTVYYNTQK